MRDARVETCLTDPTAIATHDCRNATQAGLELEDVPLGPGSGLRPVVWVLDRAFGPS